MAAQDWVSRSETERLPGVAGKEDTVVRNETANWDEDENV